MPVKAPDAVDLAGVRRGLDRLDQIAVDHPELVDPAVRGPSNVRAWEATIEGADVADPKEPTKQTAFRLPVSLLDRIERYAAARTNAAEGFAEVTRADVVRVLVTRSLDVLETERPAWWSALDKSPEKERRAALIERLRTCPPDRLERIAAVLGADERPAKPKK